MRILFALVLGLELLLVLCERNIKEEDICNPFLTSPKTSPLIPNLKVIITITIPSIHPLLQLNYY